MTATPTTSRRQVNRLTGSQSPYTQKAAINVGKGERIASIIGGALLTGSGVYAALKKSWWAAGGSFLAAGDLWYRGLTGHSLLYRSLSFSSAGKQGQRGTGVERAVTIRKTPQDLYRFWRDFDNLPRFMTHLESVRVTGPGTSHWVAKAPLGQSAEWDAVITEDIPDAKIAWRSQPNSAITNFGTVTFTPAVGHPGTVVKATIMYQPPAGAAGETIAKLFGEEPSQQVAADLRHFKQMMETGEIATTVGQPTGRQEGDKA